MYGTPAKTAQAPGAAPSATLPPARPGAAPMGLMQANGLPLPPSRPRTAVIAETGIRPQSEEQNLTRGRPLALAASGSTNIVQSATTPLALVGTTPRSRAMRWMPGPQAADVGSRNQNDGRIVPPGSVRYTNALPGEPVKPDDEQPLPSTLAGKAMAEAAAKSEARVPSIAKRNESTAVTPPEAPKRVAAAEPAKEAALAKPAPAARSGWIIQLAATDSDAKARSILDSAKEKTGKLLKQNEPFTEAVTKGTATFYRARFGGFEGESAQEACKALKRTGFNCIAQKL